MAPAENLAFTSRYRAPRVEEMTTLGYHVTLTAGEKVVDEWEKPLTIWPHTITAPFPAGAAVFDPDGVITAAWRGEGLMPCSG